MDRETSPRINGSGSATTPGSRVFVTVRGRETAKSGVDDAAFFLASVGDAAVGGMVPQSSALVDRYGGSDSRICPLGVWSSQSAPCPGGTDRAVQRRKSAPA